MYIESCLIPSIELKRCPLSGFCHNCGFLNPCLLISSNDESHDVLVFRKHHLAYINTTYKKMSVFGTNQHLSTRLLFDYVDLTD